LNPPPIKKPASIPHPHQNRIVRIDRIPNTQSGQTITLDERQQTITLTKGFIREIEGELSSVLIPDDICSLCLRMLMLNPVYFTHSDNRQKVLPVSRRLNGSEQVISGQSGSESGSGSKSSNAVCGLHPITTSTGMHEWTLKCNSYHPNDQIGIISNTANLKRMSYLFQHDFKEQHDCYFWWGDEGIYVNEKPISNELHEDDYHGTDWKEGDTLTVRVDSDRWTLVFIKNGKVVYEVIKVRTRSSEFKFYPILFCGASNTEYINQITV